MSVAKNLATVRAHVAQIAKECGADPRLVAVSKIMPAATVMQAYDVGQRHFGENYVQEICEKAPQMPEDIKWHFIGHLQSNKAKMLVKSVPGLFMVESVDSKKCASSLDKACEAAGRGPLQVMVQVNTSEEGSKSGCEPDEATEIARHVLACTRLEFKGLMTIGKLGDPNPEPYFKLLHSVRGKVAAELGVDEASLELSMGMSGDYPLAIQMGSTNVRVGSTIFGARPPKEPATPDTPPTAAAPPSSADAARVNSSATKPPSAAAPTITLAAKSADASAAPAPALREERWVGSSVVVAAGVTVAAGLPPPCPSGPPPSPLKPPPSIVSPGKAIAVKLWIDCFCGKKITTQLDHTSNSKAFM
ncbi:hypothetical protein T484DRAFT_3137539 [Baffinella frigidus]|nr:hypothetical protein T484DRAFT_3137539 [Cryptophyta sp. CCMP2293]